MVLFPSSPGFTPCGPRFSPDGQGDCEHDSLVKPSPLHASRSVHTWNPSGGGALQRSVGCETDPGVEAEEEAGDALRVQLRRKEWELEDAREQIARCAPSSVFSSPDTGLFGITNLVRPGSFTLQS